MSNHTKGPWTVRAATGEGHMIASLATNGSSTNTRLFEVVAGECPTNAEQAGNAHLISASRELLALVEAVKFSAQGGVYCEHVNGADWLTAARVAIAKAKGITA